jgi:hypothetical protein
VSQGYGYNVELLLTVLAFFFSVENAQKEINLWFGKEGVTKYA